MKGNIFATIRNLNGDVELENPTYLDESVSTPSTTSNLDKSTQDLYEEVGELCQCPVCGAINESLTECVACGEVLDEDSKFKVVDGKVVRKKKRTGPKKHLTSAQKAALAKARKLAHSSSAERSRAKSLKKSKAVNESLNTIIDCLGLADTLNEKFGDDVDAKIQYLNEEYSIVL